MCYLIKKEQKKSHLQSLILVKMRLTRTFSGMCHPWGKGSSMQTPRLLCRTLSLTESITLSGKGDTGCAQQHILTVSKSSSFSSRLWSKALIISPRIVDNTLKLTISPAQEHSRPERSKIIPFVLSFLTFLSLNKSLSRFPQVCFVIIYCLQIIIANILNFTSGNDGILINIHCNTIQLLLKRLLMMQHYKLLPFF